LAAATTSTNTAKRATVVVVSDYLPISLERYADLQAKSDSGELLAPLLAEAEVSHDSFQQAQQGWLALMATEAKRMRFGLSQRYQKAYLAARGDLLPTVKPRAFALATLTSQVGDDDLDGTSLGTPLVFAGALPFDGSQPATEPPASLSSDSPEAAATERDDECDDEPLQLAEADDAAGETKFMAALSDADVAGGALPFESSLPASEDATHSSAASDAVGIAAVGFVSEEQQSPQVEVAQAAVDETVLAGELRLDLDAALPFAGDDAAAASAAASAAPLPEVAPQDIDGTAFLSGLPDLEATPFESAPASGASSAAGGLPAKGPGRPVLTLEQYASLCAERACYPADAVAIEAKYGIRGAAYRDQLDQSWRQRLSDASLRQRFDSLYHHYVAWVRQHGAPE